MATNIQLRRGTAAEWTSTNPVLMSGELGAETDTGKIKLGNGTNTWTSLVYIGAADPLDIWPIGSIYVTNVATNPSAYFGGVWTEDGQGRCLVGFLNGDPDFGTLGATPGAKTVTLDTTMIPSHTHTQDPHNHTQNSHNHTQNSFAPRIINSGTAGTVGVQGASAASNANASNAATTATNQVATATNIAATAVNQSTGGGAAHNNIQPSLVVYFFRRIS